MTTSQTSETASGEPLTPTYRHAIRTDVPALVDLVNVCYRGDSSRRGWTTEADLLDGQRVDAEGVAELLGRTNTIVLVAEAEGLLVACCELRRGVNGAYFGMFSVRPAIQGGGLGRQVLAEAERTAVAEWGCRLMRMKVLKQRPELIAWYERRGYTSTGKIEPFPYGDETCGVPRRADLAFVELTRELPAP